MDIIIGGVYQGKLDYAKAQFSLTDSDVFFCSECPVLDLTKRCIYGFEQYLRACAQSIKKRISWYYPAGKLPKGGMG